jgi:branched-chain amino acid transport system permease protein
MVIGIRRSRPGRAMVAIRDNERAAQARGVRASSTKLAAFAVSGALAGLAGGLHAIVLDGVRAGSFSPSMSFEAFTMVVLGGATSLGGALASALFLRWAQYALTGSAQLIVTGAGVLLVLLVLPGGLGQLTGSIRQRLYAMIARARRIDLAAAAQPPTRGPGGVPLERGTAAADPPGNPAATPTATVMAGGAA